MSSLATKRQYTVWVGASEVNDFYLTKQEAIDLADEYKDDGYNDVFVELVIN